MNTLSYLSVCVSLLSSIEARCDADGILEDGRVDNIFEDNRVHTLLLDIAGDHGISDEVAEHVIQSAYNQVAED